MGDPISHPNPKSARRLGLLVGATAVLFSLVWSTAIADTGGISPGGGGGAGDVDPGPPPPACSEGASTSSASGFSLERRDASPKVDYPDDGNKPLFTYQVGDVSTPVDVEIRIVNEGTGETVKNYCPEDVEPDVPHTVQWDNTTNSGAQAAKGKYVFKLLETNGTKPPSDGAGTNHHFQWRGHIFPLHGTPHYYGDGWGAGRGHRGQDLFENGFPSPCGAPLLAARHGFVAEKRSQAGAAGNYIVIHSNETDRSYVYLHLQGKTLNSFVSQGQEVRTGQQIATMGSSGNASACHLHFELWTSPWKQYDPTPSLKKWDRWS
jgi:murein DD-endopeptidase MepM/ murein hydrolase activator NlpD